MTKLYSNEYQWLHCASLLKHFTLILCLCEFKCFCLFFQKSLLKVMAFIFLPLIIDTFTIGIHKEK